MITTELNGNKLTIEGVWVSQDGRKTGISLMDTTHIVNTHAMLVRNLAQGRDGYNEVTVNHNTHIFEKELIRRERA